MAIWKRSALIISSNVNGLDPLEGVYQNVAGASKVLMGMEILPDCSYGGELSLSEFMEKIEKFFGKESEVHILWGIFHGAVAFDGEKQIGCWVLFNNERVSLSCILQKWYFARDKGTAHHLLIISDACYSGHMVTEAAELALRDVSVQASCHPNLPSSDTEGECFSDLLVWRLERRYGFQCHRERKIDMKVHLERSIPACHQPCFHSALGADDLGWAFIDTYAVFSDLSDSSESCSLAGSVPESKEGRLSLLFVGEVVIVCFLLMFFQIFKPGHGALDNVLGDWNVIQNPSAAVVAQRVFNFLRGNHAQNEHPGASSGTHAPKRLRGCRLAAWVDTLARAGMWRRRRMMRLGN